MQLEQTYTNWNIERLSRHFLYWLVWVLFYAGMNYSNCQMMDYWEWTQVEMYLLLAKIPFTYLVIYVLVPIFFIRKQYVYFIVLGLLTSIIGGYFIRWIYIELCGPAIFIANNYEYSPKPIFYQVLDLVYVAALPMVLKLFQKSVQQEKETLELAQERLGAELTILKNQLHPHFLFNTLNNLYGMVLTKHSRAADVVVRLSDIMSYMLYDCNHDKIDLEKEVAHLKNYIELEKIRYGQRLDISFETNGDWLDKKIAPLVFIAFVENAFKHGIGKSEEHEWIRINLVVNENELALLVENSLSNKDTNDENDLPKTQSGIGLKNVQKRLELLYPNKYTLEIKEEDTFLVNLKMTVT